MPKKPLNRHGDLDLLVAIDGQISNQRIRDLFGIERAHASRLIVDYLEWRRVAQKPDLVREGALWTLPHPHASGDMSKSDLDRYIELTGRGTVTGWLEDAAADFAMTDTAVLRGLAKACVGRSPVQIQYTSLTSAGVSERIIYPHTVVRTGRRLHVRAWCVTRQDYRDFALPRISSITFVDHNEPPSGTDALWTEHVDLRIGPHVALGQQQQRAVRREFMEGTAARRLTVRAALVHYVINAIEAAIDPEKEKPPRFQLQLLNVEDVRPYLFSGADKA